MSCLLRFPRRLVRPKFLLLLGAIIFAFLGTFYWMLWDIPQMPWLSSSRSSSSAEVGTVSGGNWEEEEDLLDSIHFNLPEPLQCDKEIRTHKPQKNFCQYNSTLQDCYELLMSDLHEQPSWVFLGDSSMATLAYYVSLKWPFDSLNTTSQRHACQNIQYYRLPPPSDGWVPPDPTKGEGPIDYGVAHPYCMDCQKCWNVLMNVPTSEDTYVEYLVVEYARDVSIPTQVTQTTQETAAYYLNLKSPKVCVASAGLLDASIDPPITIDLYIQNVDAYLELLTRTCQSVIWIGIPAIFEDPAEYPQRNCQLHEWNNAVYALVDLRGYSNVYIMDIWEKSMNTDHVGSLVLTGKFYASLARLFVTLMAGPNMGTQRHLEDSAFRQEAATAFGFEANEP
jgi:hypothetical protein